MFDNGPDILQD